MKETTKKTISGDKPSEDDAAKWLKPATASLQRLQQVKTNVYHLGFTDVRQLAAETKQPPNLHAGKSPDLTRDTEDPEVQKTKHAVEDAGPPLTKLKNTCAWGSNSSIPNLIRHQNERQKSRPESAKLSRPNRPLSGKKPRPQSAKNKLATDPHPTTADQPTLGVVKGSKYDPSLRPDGSSVNLAGSGWIGHAPNATTSELIESEKTIKDVADSQPQFEYSNVDENDVYDEMVTMSDGLPRPPRASPDFMHILHSTEDGTQEGSRSINNMVDSLFDTDDINGRPMNPGIDIQKKADLPPIRLPVAEEEDEDIRISFELSSDRVGSSPNIPVQKYSTPSQNHNISPGQKSTKAWQSHDIESPHTLVSDLEITNLDNPSHLTPQELTKASSNEDLLFAYPRRVEVNLVIEDKGDISKGDSTRRHQNSGHQGTVHFDENKNMTFDITPREKKPRPQSGKVYSGRSDLRHVKSRTDSGISVSNKQKVPDTDRDLKVTGLHSDRTNNHSSSKLSTLTVNFDSDSDSEPSKGVLRGFKKVDRRHTDTLMSKSPPSDGFDLCESGTDEETNHNQFGKQFSKTDRNYYELSKTSGMSRKKSESDTEDGSKGRVKTIKTIELTGEGFVRETVSLSNIEGAEHKVRKEYIAPRPPSASRNKARPTSATLKKAPGKDEKSQPTNAVHERPEARLGFHEDKLQHPEVENIDLPGTTNIKKERVSSAPPVRSGRKISDVIKLNRDRPLSGQICGCKRNSHTHSKSSSDLKKGSTTMAAKPSRDKSARRYYTGYATQETKKKMDTPVYDGKIVEIWTRKEDFEVETEGVKDCKDLQMKLLEAGVPVTLETLKRGLLPPTEYGFSGPTYKSTIHPTLPPNYTDHLLNNPKNSWLSRENKQVTDAKRRVRDATRALEQQRLEEVRLALAAETKTLKKSTKGRKGKKKRSKSVN